MTRRHLTTAITMSVLAVILVITLMVGFDKLFAPLPKSNSPAAQPSPTCDAEQVRKGERLRSRQVVVNVYNGGTRSGLAGQTQDALRVRGFRAGEVGNAPSGNRVRRAQVWIQKGEEAAGRLVAKQFGPKTPVRRKKKDLAEGIDVVVGNGFEKLKRAPRSIVVKQKQKVCLPLPGAETGDL